MLSAFLRGARAGAVVTLTLFAIAAGVGWLLDRRS